MMALNQATATIPPMIVKNASSILFNITEMPESLQNKLSLRLSFWNISLESLLRKKKRGKGCDRKSGNGKPDMESDGIGIRAATSDNMTETMTYENATAHMVTSEDEAHTMNLLHLAGRQHKHHRKLSSQGEEEEGDDGSESEDGDGAEESDDGSEDSTEAEESSEHQANTKATVRAASPHAEQSTSAEVIGENGMGAPESRHAYTNVTHLSMMLLKIIKTYKIKSMVDIPCRNTLDFVPTLLHTLDFEIAGFKYYCVDTEKETHDDIAHLYGDAGSPDIIHMKAEHTSRMPKADLVFSWDGPQDWGVTNTWTFFTNLRQIRPKYLLITNNPGENNGDKAGIVNLRKQPFHFAQATRVISHVHLSEAPKKQLLFYEIDSIRRGF